MPSIEDVPTYLATTWDIPLLAAQAILSTVVLLFVLLPVFLATKGKGALMPVVFFILTEAVLVSIEWLDAWLMILTVLVIAIVFARTGSDIFSEGG